MTLSKLAVPKITFSKSIGFRKELNRRVEAYFETENISQRDNLAMYLKTAIICAWVLSAWLFILFVPSSGLVKILGCVVLALGMVAFAFNVGHDANHGSYSSRKWVNSLFGFALDVLGASSYLWRYSHNKLHHTYTNIAEHDFDINGEGLVRLSPDQESRWFYRYQHIYTWLLYGFLQTHWFVEDINVLLLKRKYYNHEIPTPKPVDVITFFAFKVFWLAYVIGLPLWLGYTPLQIIVGFVITTVIFSFLVALVFRVAHVVDNAEFITPHPETSNVDDEWAICQVRTTVDFAPKNHFLNWYLGGLNYQVIHHLFPHICHIHYPKLSKIVKEVCDEFDVEYRVNETFAEAIVANYRLVKALGNS
ncbi:MAG: acyl-CoA desaturase [Microcoleus vaginatus WJT46-NPBG5]|jgi:linoleoyl-CoA desaturase|nr:acyl-CoA desaturase [Microcoleus vaginatus WJT46-NPBG5]